MGASRDDRPRCYVASPLGFSEAGRHYYRTVYLPALADVVMAVDPWSLTSEDEVAVAQARGRERTAAREIGLRNIEAIKGSTLLAAYLDGQEIDSGTAAEVGYGAALGLRCFGLRTDFRQSGEPGASVNLQLETFIVESGGRVCATLEELVGQLGLAGAAS